MPKHPLARWREFHGLARTIAAREAGVHRNVWRRIEQREGSCTVDTAIQIFDYVRLTNARNDARGRAPEVGLEDLRSA